MVRRAFRQPAGVKPPRRHPRRQALLGVLAVIGVVILAVQAWIALRSANDHSARTVPTAVPTAPAGAGTTAPGAPTSARTVPTVTVTIHPMTTQLPTPVSRAVVVADGADVLIVGGLNAAKHSIINVTRFDPTAGTMRALGRLAIAVHDSAGAVLNGRVVVFGGGTDTGETDAVQAFSPADRVASRIGHLPHPRSDHVAVVDGSRALVVGGFDGSQPALDILATSDGTSFDVVARLAQPVRYPAAAVVGRTLYVFGGEWTGQASSAIQAVDLTSGTTHVSGQLPGPLAHAVAVTLNDRIYLAGGRTGTAGYQNVVWAFDPTASAVHQAGRLPSPESDASATTIGSTAYLCGGEDPATRSAIVALTSP
jgi:hypothetical protein